MEDMDNGDVVSNICVYARMEIMTFARLEYWTDGSERVTVREGRDKGAKMHIDWLGAWFA
jgi:hypothetical protein